MQRDDALSQSDGVEQRKDRKKRMMWTDEKETDSSGEQKKIDANE